MATRRIFNHSNAAFQKLIDEGTAIRADLHAFLEARPEQFRSDPDYRERTEEPRHRVLRWINEVVATAGPFMVQPTLALQDSANSMHGSLFREAKEDPKQSLDIYTDQLLSWIAAAADPTTLPSWATHNTSLSSPVVAHERNTGFIVIWMDPNQPELEDVSDTFKQVFKEFGIDAVRANDVEHQEVITDVILERIRRAEFLIADLTGERPNVYYEIGFAHAIGKRPILFRKEGTAIHFDLALHNVPDYRNLKELREKLRRRLEAITGRKAELDSPQ